MEIDLEVLYCPFERAHLTSSAAHHLATNKHFKQKIIYLSVDIVFVSIYTWVSTRYVRTRSKALRWINCNQNQCFPYTRFPGFLQRCSTTVELGEFVSRAQKRRNNGYVQDCDFYLKPWLQEAQNLPQIQNPLMWDYMAPWHAFGMDDQSRCISQPFKLSIHMNIPVLITISTIWFFFSFLDILGINKFWLFWLIWGYKSTFLIILPILATSNWPR